MLDLIDIPVENAVAFRISGKITESEMHAVLTQAREKIDSYGRIVFLERIDSFTGIEIAALVEEFRYLFETGFSNIAKVAIVTDKKWIERIVKIEDKLFKNIEIKYFTIDDQDEAIEFLKHS